MTNRVNGIHRPWFVQGCNLLGDRCGGCWELNDAVSYSMTRWISGKKGLTMSIALYAIGWVLIYSNELPCVHSIHTYLSKVQCM